MEWNIQKLCADVGDYELVVELQKRTWECDHTIEEWKWGIVHMGIILSNGCAIGLEEAQRLALLNVPADNVKTDQNCGCD